MTILTFVGELNTFYSPTVAREIDSIIMSGEIRLVLNLGQVVISVATFFGLLLKFLKQCREGGGDLVLTQPSKVLKKTSSTLGLAKVLILYDTDEEGVQHFLRAREDGGATGKAGGT